MCQPGRHRQSGQQVRLSQQQADTAVFEHIGKTFSRVFRVQRHIGTACLENRQQTDHQLQRAFAGNTDPHFRADTLLAQCMRETVGPLIQLGVSQTLPGKYQRAGIRGGRRLCFDMQMHALGALIVLLCGIEAIERGLAFARREHRQLANGALGVGHYRAQQVAPMAGQGVDARGVKQVGGVGQAGQQPLAFFVGVQLQVELSGAALPRQAFDFKACEHPAQRAGTALLVVEHHLKQRTVTQAALALQGIDQTLERHVLITLGIQRAVAGLLQQTGKRQAPVQLGAQYLGVDEKTDKAMGFGTVAVGHRHADTQVGLPAVAMQQRLKTGQQQHKRGHAALARQRHQALGQCGLQCKVQPRALLGRLRGARTVAGQFKHGLFRAQLRAPPVQLALQLTCLHPAPLPQRVVGVLNRQGRQLGAAALGMGMGGVERRELFDQYAHRPTIGDDMVQDQHQHMVVVVQLHQADAQQRAVLQIERLGDVLLDLTQRTGHALWRGLIA